MRRPAMTTFVLLLCACGDDGAATLPTGTFRLVAETVGGATTPSERLHGALELTGSQLALGVASTRIAGALGSYTVNGDSLRVAGGPTYTTAVAGNRITVAQGAQSSWTFEPFTPAASNTLAVNGSVTLPASEPALAHPRIAMVFVSLDMPYVSSPRDDRELTFTAGTASFDLSRTDGPLGIEVIEWQSRTVVTSIAYVIVYDDRNSSSNLNELAVCSGTTLDCIRAVSPVLVAYRNGETPALAASQYGQLRSGWTHVVPVQHASLDKLGLVSLDQGVYRHDLTIGAASAVVIPQFEVNVP